MSDRLPKSPTQIIDRSKTITIFYDQKPIPCFRGDTVASCLYASGVRSFYSSFKYHRPRGIFELGVHSADPAMEVNGRLNTRIARAYAAEGMKVVSQSGQKFDLMKLADKAGKATSVGFYYKNSAFYKSATAWNKARDLMRSAPGNLGEVKTLTQRPLVEEVNLTPELLVVGAGLAGMEAALIGAKAQIRVVLVEAEPFLGGFHAFQGTGHLAYLDEIKNVLQQFDNLKILKSTTASMAYPDGLFVCLEKCSEKDRFFERSWLIRPQCVVFATGAMDRPLVFENNDRPGVMLPQTVQRLIHLYGVKPGSRVVLSGADRAIYKTAWDLEALGIEIAGIADFSKPQIENELKEGLRKKGIPIFEESSVIDVKGKRSVTAAIIAGLEQTEGHIEKCDLVVAASGRTCLFKLPAQAEAKVEYNQRLGLHLITDLRKNHVAVGRLNGLSVPGEIRSEAREFTAKLLNENFGLSLPVEEAIQRNIEPNPAQIRGKGWEKRRFICLGNDVTEKDIDIALQEGFDNKESIKRYTTATMGPEQGALSQANFLDYLAFKKPETMGNHSINTPRPPLAGASLAVMAAGHHDQPKLPPTHDIQLKNGGRPFRAGPWIRIEDFGNPKEETMAVHNTCGLADVSTLGKFRIFGKDSSKWLNRINLKSVDNLEYGKVLYTAATNEEGVVIDDGVIIKIAEDDYYFTTSTARAPFTRQWYLKYKRGEDWQCHLVDLTETKAGMNLAGPNSRKVLAQLSKTDFSNQAFPFMTWIETELAEVPVFILRMGFLGELSYEIHCPSNSAGFLWEEIRKKGEAFGLRQVGLETQFVCRLEKGHILPGLDCDGNTTMFESSFQWLWNKNKNDNVGGPLLGHLRDMPLKNQCIAFSVSQKIDLKDGNLVVKGDKRLGYITSLRYSHFLKKTIGLALVEPHHEFKPGGSVYLWLNGKEIEAKYEKTPFLDPEGRRMRI